MEVSGVTTDSSRQRGTVLEFDSKEVIGSQRLWKDMIGLIERVKRMVSTVRWKRERKGSETEAVMSENILLRNKPDLFRGPGPMQNKDMLTLTQLTV